MLHRSPLRDTFTGLHLEEVQDPLHEVVRVEHDVVPDIVKKSIKENDCYPIIEQALAEDKHVQGLSLWDAERVQDGENGHRVDGRDQGAVGERICPRKETAAQVPEE